MVEMINILVLTNFSPFEKSSKFLQGIASNFSKIEVSIYVSMKRIGCIEIFTV